MSREPVQNSAALRQASPLIWLSYSPTSRAAETCSPTQQSSATNKTAYYLPVPSSFVILAQSSKVSLGVINYLTVS